MNTKDNELKHTSTTQSNYTHSTKTKGETRFGIKRYYNIKELGKNYQGVRQDIFGGGQE
jgi:hypothetical protein